MHSARRLVSVMVKALVGESRATPIKLMLCPRLLVYIFLCKSLERRSRIGPTVHQGRIIQPASASISTCSCSRVHHPSRSGPAVYQELSRAKNSVTPLPSSISTCSCVFRRPSRSRQRDARDPQQTPASLTPTQTKGSVDLCRGLSLASIFQVRAMFHDIGLERNYHSSANQRIDET